MKRRPFLAALGSSLVLTAATPAVASTPGRRLREEFLRAVRTGDLTKVRAMLRADGALVYARDREGRSAYVLAHLTRQQAVARELVDHGFTKDIVEASLAFDWDRIDEIGEQAPGVINADHPIGGTAMYAAAFAGMGSDLWRLQQYGGDPNANPRGADGVTPVRMAMDHPDALVALETAATLLGNGGDPNRPQRDGSRALHGAAATGHLDLIRLVVRKGGDPAARDVAGRTPEDVARSLGHTRAADLLQGHAAIRRDHRTSRFAYRADGSRFVAPDLEGYDPKLRNRLVGASHFNLEVATEITDQFPSLATAVSYFDEGAVEAAAHTGRRSVARLLLDRGAPYSLPTAGTMADLEWAKRLLAEDPQRVDERGAHDFAMMWYPAIGGGSVDMATLLIEHGADIHQEHLGTTGLHFAVRGAHEDLTVLFLDHGADPDAIGRKFTRAGQTPLDHAAARDDRRMIELLGSRGARRRVEG